jgi:serine/threonine-protein kinase
MAEVAEAIDHAHRQGIIHRDLKPGNVQVTPDDRAKVLDLGLALVRGEEQMDARILGGRKRVVGTMDYIAPEQTTDATQVDARSDIYSLGCTLYFVLAGRPPFPGGTNRDKIRCHRSEEPVPLPVLRPGLPTALTGLVARMMAKDPAARPPSAGLVAAELRLVAATPEKPDGRALDGPAARPSSPGCLGMLVGLYGLAGGVVWYCLAG